jgi:hypothetical protein
MAGLKVVSVQTLLDGSLDLVDLKAKAQKHKDQLAAFMVGVMTTSKPTFTSETDHLPFHVRCIRGRCARRKICQTVQYI